MRGKKVWKSLKARDPKQARRALKDEQDKSERIDTEAAKLSLSGLCKDYVGPL
jgi:hypothetical protein